VTIVVVGIVLLAILVWSRSGTTADDAATPTTPSATATVTDEPTMTEEPTTPAEPVGAVEAPTSFVALRSADGMNLRWKAPMATDGLTGFNVELKPAGGEWAVVATTGPTELTHAVMLSSSDSWTQFRVSSVYADGQTASAKIFGLAGQYE
jgi:cytoskeletal protein RodZ